MNIPLDDISDGYIFQQIVAAYFRYLKERKQKFSITDIEVVENGVGGDDCCDIVVEFFYEDAISKHSQKWVVESKFKKASVGLSDIKTNNLETILNANDAVGYLLICKNDATASLKRIFNNLNRNQKHKYIIWNGLHFWLNIIKSESLLKALFPDHFKEYYMPKKKNFEKIMSKLSDQYKLNK